MLKDMDHFKVQPGDVLVLRAKKPMSAEQLAQIMDYFGSMDLPFQTIIIPTPDLEVMIGSVVPDADVQEPIEDDADEKYQRILEAYEAGRTIEYRVIRGHYEWVQCHRIVSPHAFDRNLYAYRFVGGN